MSDKRSVSEALAEFQQTMSNALTKLQANSNIANVTTYVTLTTNENGLSVRSTFEMQRGF